MPEAAQKRRAQLMQRGEREFHLRFGTGRPHDLAAARPLQHVIQQRGLTGPRLAAQDEYLALSRPDTGHQPIQHAALVVSAEQPVLDPWIGRLGWPRGRLAHVEVSGGRDFLTGR
jgi:hypothetical protein